MQNKSFIRRFLFLCDVAIRALTPLVLWANPLAAYATNALVDGFDGDVLARVGVKRPFYQHSDKLLDILWVGGLYVFFLMHLPTNPTAVSIMQFAFAIRAIGLVAFMAFNREWLLFIFPETFATLYFIWLFFPQIWATQLGITGLLSVLIPYSFLKEWLIHVAKKDITHLLFPFINPKVW